MKILMYTWNVFHERDMIDAFLSLGHEVDILNIKLKSHNEDMESLIKVTEILENTPYDFVLSVNYFGVLSDACLGCNVKYVSWTCDSPLISMHHESVFNECNYLFIFDQVSYYTFKSLGLKHVFYLPLAVHVKRLDELIQNATDLERFHSDISFVGSLYHKNSYDDIKDKLSEYLKGYFEAAMLAQIDIHGENLFDKLLTPEILYELSNSINFEQDDRSFSNIALTFSTTFLGFKAASMERINCLNELAKKNQVDLYTDNETDQLNGVNVKGSVNYLNDMPKVFHGSKINLNFTIRNIRSGIPLRVWDVMGAGGFMLSNFQAEIPSYFELGKDLVCFDSILDMCRKAEYYLLHEDERIQIAYNGYEKVKNYHSYENRIKEILRVIK